MAVDDTHGGPVNRLVVALDRTLGALATLFLWIANICLFLMLCATAVTIIIRPFGMSIYWLWPWSMVVFVWMSFFGFFVIYRRRKDIAVDFVMRKLGRKAMVASRYFVALVVIAVASVLLWQAPAILAQQVGVVDGVLMPGGWEMQRYALSLPLFLSAALILTNAVLDIAKASLGWPEPAPDHSLGDE